MTEKNPVSRRSLLAGGVAVTATLAGCTGGSDSGPTESPTDTPDQTEMDESGTSDNACQTPDGDLTAVFPDTDEYTLSSTETFSDNAPYGIRSAIGIYRDLGESPYEFLVIEFEDAATAQEMASEVVSDSEFAETGYLTAEQYFYGLGGESRDVITALMGESSPLAACVDSELQFR